MSEVRDNDENVDNTQLFSFGQYDEGDEEDDELWLSSILESDVAQFFEEEETAENESEQSEENKAEGNDENKGEEDENEEEGIGPLELDNVKSDSFNIKINEKAKPDKKENNPENLLSAMPQGEERNKSFKRMVMNDAVKVESFAQGESSKFKGLMSCEELMLSEEFVMSKDVMKFKGSMTFGGYDLMEDVKKKSDDDRQQTMVATNYVFDMTKESDESDKRGEREADVNRPEKTDCEKREKNKKSEENKADKVKAEKIDFRNQRGMEKEEIGMDVVKERPVIKKEAVKNRIKERPAVKKEAVMNRIKERPAVKKKTAMGEVKDRLSHAKSSCMSMDRESKRTKRRSEIWL